MSLFSVFDPSTSLIFSMNWVSLFVVVIYIPIVFYLSSGGLEKMFKKMVGFLVSDFSEVSYPNSYGVVFFGVFVFFFIVLSNLMGLFVYVFTSTSHPVVTMSLGVVGWVSFFLLGWGGMFKKSSSHLVPQGSPLGLSFFLVIVEMISHLIRPFTLSVRLAANMMAGHLIIGLLSMVSEISFTGMLVSVVFQFFLLILELGVCLIQGMVFSILLMLYMLEYY